MHQYINFNGALIDRETPVATAANRSLRYGDGLFETIHWNGSLMKALDFHLDRLFHGLDVLSFDLSGGFTRQMISDEMKKLCHANAPIRPARLRLNVYRADSIQLRTKQNKPAFIIETAEMPELSERPLNITLFPDEQKSTGLLSNLKTNNYLLNILALQFADRLGFDDALIMNSRYHICECSSSNLFLICDGEIFTPALAEGCVAGTKRRELLERLPSWGFRVSETAVTPDMLKAADEVFLTNAIRQIQSVSGIDGRNYQTGLTEKIIRIFEQETD